VNGHIYSIEVNASKVEKKTIEPKWGETEQEVRFTTNGFNGSAVKGQAILGLY
jgi:hypothetical protein